MHDFMKIGLSLFDNRRGVTPGQKFMTLNFTSVLVLINTAILDSID